MIDGNRIYYNFIRPHMALSGKTPAEKAGIDLQLEDNRWESLIRRSARHKKWEVISYVFGKQILSSLRKERKTSQPKLV